MKRERNLKEVVKEATRWDKFKKRRDKIKTENA